VSTLFPEGVRSLVDLPWMLFEAIVNGLQFLAFEELPDEERPKRGIWLDQDKMRAHFKAVKKQREEKYGTDSKPAREIDDPVENDAAKSWKEQYA
jgi:hypothetical protein